MVGSRGGGVQGWVSRGSGGPGVGKGLVRVQGWLGRGWWGSRGWVGRGGGMVGVP